ncbi:MAG: phosphodiester glycosidase family protein, partial [Clostridia bacterium]|nr:phosphodiester glycosidase family protein [Clostridia bacterium]
TPEGNRVPSATHEITPGGTSEGKFSPTPTPTPEPTPTPTPTPEPTPTPVPATIVFQDEYRTDDVVVVVTQYREYSTDIYVADVKVSDPFLFKTALAKNKFGKNIIQTTSTQAKNNNAILAINGDFYGKRENGYMIRDGQIWRKTVSDKRERNTYDDLAVLQDGSFRIFDESKTSFEEVASWGPWQVFSFGPALIVDGEIVVGEDDDVMNKLSSNPRTAIAMIEPLHYIFFVSDGRTSKSAGLSLLQMAEFMKKLGATQAYNLDGGGSSAMYFNGKIINNPVNSGRITERFVSDIVYIPK